MLFLRFFLGLWTEIRRVKKYSASTYNKTIRNHEEDVSKVLLKEDVSKVLLNITEDDAIAPTRQHNIFGKPKLARLYL